MEIREENNLKVFNTAKKLADEILFPIMKSYYENNKKSNLGAKTEEEALMLTEEIREIERYNGLKAMNDSVGSLLNSITSTIRLNKKQEEIEKIEELSKITKKLKDIFYDEKHKFFTKVVRNSFEMEEKIDRRFFEMIKEIIECNYINVEILMSRNNLLFADNKDDFKNDEQIKEEIMKRYVEN